jgi:hypothetical protein
MTWSSLSPGWFKTMTALIEQNEAVSRDANVLSGSIRMYNGTSLSRLPPTTKALREAVTACFFMTKFGASSLKKHAGSTRN